MLIQHATPNTEISTSVDPPTATIRRRLPPAMPARPSAQAAELLLHLLPLVDGRISVTSPRMAAAEWLAAHGMLTTVDKTADFHTVVLTPCGRVWAEAMRATPQPLKQVAVSYVMPVRRN